MREQDSKKQPSNSANEGQKIQPDTEQEKLTLRDRKQIISGLITKYKGVISKLKER